MASPQNEKSLLSDGQGRGLITTRQANVSVVVDALDGATLTGSTLTTSATPTVDELEACVGVLGGKINAVLALLETHGLMIAG